MQIHCPNCAEKIRAENINIQDKIAVCSACDTVFKFEVAEAKAKRRKIKQPQNLILRDGDKLQMDFRTNFRLDRDEGFIGGGIIAVFATVISALLYGQSFAGDVPLIAPIAFSVLALVLYYVVALTVFNHTEVEMDDESIRVSRKPLPSLRNNQEEISLSGIARIYTEETPRSIKDAFDTPRYHVWAEMQDGGRKLIVADLVEDYAYFVAQTLEERLMGDELNTAHLEDVLEDADSASDEVPAKTASSKS